MNSFMLVFSCLSQNCEGAQEYGIPRFYCYLACGSQKKAPLYFANISGTKDWIFMKVETVVPSFVF